MNFIDIVKQLIQTSDIEKQTQIVKKAWEEDCDEFFVGIEMSLDESLDFKLKSVPEIQDPDDGEEGTFKFDDFKVLTAKLLDPELDDKTRKSLVNEAALSANITEWNLWYRRILLKNLHKYLPFEVIASTLMNLTKR